MAEYNIVMKQKNNQGDYDILYPATLSSQVTGTFPATSITYDNSQTSNIVSGNNVQLAIDQTCQYIIDNPGGEIPIGVIVIWSGATNNIPNGWQLCNGTNGTPDLRNRFVVGAGSTYSVGNTGGEATHTLTKNEMPSHNHNLLETPVGNGTANKLWFSSDNQTLARSIDRQAGGSQNAATMLMSSILMSNTGNSQPHNNLPPYYALCYIMKIA